jgi:hypothetical protein
MPLADRKYLLGLSIWNRQISGQNRSRQHFRRGATSNSGKNGLASAGELVLNMLY